MLQRLLKLIKTKIILKMMQLKIIQFCNRKYFKRVIYSTNNTFYAHYWQSKGLSDEKLLIWCS